VDWKSVDILKSGTPCEISQGSDKIKIFTDNTEDKVTYFFDKPAAGIDGTYVHYDGENYMAQNNGNQPLNFEINGQNVHYGEITTQVLTEEGLGTIKGEGEQLVTDNMQFELSKGASVNNDLKEFTTKSGVKEKLQVLEVKGGEVNIKDTNLDKPIKLSEGMTLETQTVDQSKGIKTFEYKKIPDNLKISDNSISVISSSKSSSWMPWLVGGGVLLLGVYAISKFKSSSKSNTGNSSYPTPTPA
jgi:hypothetical protein